MSVIKRWRLPIYLVVGPSKRLVTATLEEGREVIQNDSAYLRLQARVER